MMMQRRLLMLALAVLSCLVLLSHRTPCAMASDAAPSDYYKVLGVPRSATSAQIKKKYRQMARKYHPDLNKGKGVKERFQSINKAYEVLGDEQKRKDYDMYGTDDFQQGMGGGGPPRGSRPQSGGGTGGSPFTGTHFDGFYNFNGPQQQRGGGGWQPPPFGGAGAKSTQASKRKPSTSTGGGFSFEKMFGANVFGDDASHRASSKGSSKRAAPSRETEPVKKSWMETLFGGMMGGDGSADAFAAGGGGSSTFDESRTSTSGHQAATKRNTKSKGQKRPPASMFHDEKYANMFDATNPPPREMFEGDAPSADPNSGGASPDSNEHFQQWFAKKFGNEPNGGGPPGGGGGDPSASSAKRKPKQKDKRQTTDGKSRKGPSSAKAGGPPSQQSSARKEKKQSEGTTTKPTKTKATHRYLPTEVWPFSAEAYNVECLEMKQRCVILFGASSTFLSAKSLFKHAASELGGAKLQGPKAVGLASSRKGNARLLFVPSHNISVVTDWIRTSLVSAGDPCGAQRALCAPYGTDASKRFAKKPSHLVGEYCVLVISGSGKRVAVVGKHASVAATEGLCAQDDWSPISSRIRTEQDLIDAVNRIDVILEEGGTSASTFVHRLPQQLPPIETPE